jgi:hypothetical protein
MQRDRKKSRWKTKRMMGRPLFRRSELPATHITDNELDSSDDGDDDDAATKYCYRRQISKVL